MKARRSPSSTDVAILKALTCKPRPGKKPGATTAELAQLTGKHASAVQLMLHRLHAEGRLVITRIPWPSLDGAMRLHNFYRLRGR